MATVRLHTQHHSAGGLRPATPTCCCCSCCCVGSTLATVTVLPMMIGRYGANPQPKFVVPSSEHVEEAADQEPSLARPISARSRGWAEGVGAFIVAVSPVPLSLAFGPEVLFFAALAALVILIIWAMNAADRAGRPIWSPLLVTVVLLPIGFFVELYLAALFLVSNENEVGYLLGAGAIFAAIFAAGWRLSGPARRR